MRKPLRSAVLLTGIICGPVSCTQTAAPPEPGASEQVATATVFEYESIGELPAVQIYPDSGNRLPLVRREDLDEQGQRAYDAAISAAGEPRGAAAIRLHGSGVNVRWESPLGRRLTELAILTQAREYHQPYEWSLHEMEAVAVGLEPEIVDVVRDQRPVARSVPGLGDREAVIIQMGRELFGESKLSPETYARALQLFGKSNLVDVAGLMAQYAGTATRLTAVNQHMPSGWKNFLPLPFTRPADIHPDTRSRLPLVLRPTQTQQAATPENPGLYRRTLAPEGTGPGQIGRHGAGLASLEASVGRRLMSLAVLVTSRPHNQQYHWTINELAARRDGLDTAVIDIVRENRPVTGLDEPEAALITFGRELFGQRNIGAETYAQVLERLRPDRSLGFHRLDGSARIGGTPVDRVRSARAGNGVIVRIGQTCVRTCSSGYGGRARLA